MSISNRAQQIVRGSSSERLVRCQVESNDLLREVDSSIHRMMLAFLSSGDAAKQEIAHLIDRADHDARTERARIGGEIAQAQAALEAVTPAPAVPQDPDVLAAARADAEREAARLLERARQHERDMANRLERTQQQLAEIESQVRQQLSANVAAGPEQVEIVITGVSSYPSAFHIMESLRKDSLTKRLELAEFAPGRLALRLETIKLGLDERIIQQLNGSVEAVTEGAEAGTFRVSPSGK